jgi:glutamate synthase (NADPH/NADH) large chain
VLDEFSNFENHCNPELVELEALGAEDCAFVAELLEEHIRLTGSKKARELMSVWEQTLTRFIKVVPVEYRRVLEELAQKRDQEPPVRRDSIRILRPTDPLSGEAPSPAEAE